MSQEKDEELVNAATKNVSQDETASKTENAEQNVYHDFVGQAIFNTHKIVLLSGTVYRILSGTSKRGSKYFMLRLDLTNAAESLNKIANAPKDFPSDQKYSQVTLWLHGKQAESVKKMNLKQNESIDGNFQFGDRVTVIGYNLTTQTREYKGKTYYGYQLQYLNLFKQSVLSAVRPLFSYKTKKNNKVYVALLRGKLASVPEEKNVKDNKYSQFELSIENGKNVHRALQAISMDKEGNLPEHKEEIPYKIFISAWGRMNEYVQKHDWQVGDHVEVLSIITGLYKADNPEVEPKVEAFVKSMRRLKTEEPTEDEVSTGAPIDSATANVSEKPSVDPFAEDAASVDIQ